MPFNGDKFQVEIQKVREACDELEEIVGALHLLILQATFANNQANLNTYNAILDRIGTLTNNMAAPPLGHIAELRSWYKHHAQKGRAATLGGNADVMIQYENGRRFAGKAVQHKSTTGDQKAAVTEHLRVAANQIAGERGQNPPVNYRRIIDIEIHSPSNTWPFPDTQARGTRTLPQYRTAAAAELESQLASTAYIQHNPPGTAGKGLNPATRGSLTNWNWGGQWAATGAKRTELIGQVQVLGPFGVLQNQVFRIVGITVKIHYSFPYALSGTQQRIKDIAFEVIRDTTNAPTNMRARVTKETLV